MSATEELRALLDERGVEHYDVRNATYWGTDGAEAYAYSIREGADGLLDAHIHDLTPEQVIAAMLGKRHAYEQRITGEGSDWGEIMADAFDELMASASESCAPDELARLRWHIAATLGGLTWRDSYDQERFDRWYDSLHHNGKPTNFAELVEEIIWMCETIDLGPNGNTCQGVDEGEVYTDGLINHWAEFAATLGVGRLTADQVREAIERNFGKVAVLDDGKPVEWRGDWVCKVGVDYRAITDELNAALCSVECENVSEDAEMCNFFECSECGCRVEDGELYHVSVWDSRNCRCLPWSFCPNCGRKVKR